MTGVLSDELDPVCAMDWEVDVAYKIFVYGILYSKKYEYSRGHSPPPSLVSLCPPAGGIRMTSRNVKIDIL